MVVFWGGAMTEELSNDHFIRPDEAFYIKMQ